MTDRKENGRVRLLLPFLVVLVVGCLCVVAYEHYTRWLPPLSADETGHALPAARLAFDLRRGDSGAFITHTQGERTWPFVHPWALAAFFLAGGVSTNVGRASSLAFFGLAVVLAFVLARELSRGSAAGRTDHEPPRPDQGEVWVGVPTALLMILTADFWMHSSLILIEPLGMAVTLAGLLAYAAALRRRTGPGFLAAGLLAAATFLTKYNYGLPLALALVLSTVLARGTARPDRRALVLLFVGLVVPVAAWLAYPFPEKILGLYGFSVNRDEGLSGLADLLFYPRQVAGILSWPVAFGLLAAVASSLRALRDPRSAAPPLFALLGLVMITAHPNKQVRYAFTVLPVLYVLAELELRGLARRFLPVRAGPFAGVALLALLAWTLDPRPVLRDDRRNAQELREAASILDFVVSRLDPAERTLVLGSCGRLPHLLVQWELVTRRGATEAVVDLLTFPGEGPWDPRYRRGYPTAMTPDYHRALESALGPGGYDRIVTLQIAPGSVFMPDWLARWDAWGQNYVVLMQRQSLYPLIAEQEFPKSAVAVRLYARPRPSP